jgi:dephospho-CoA kinase
LPERKTSSPKWPPLLVVGVTGGIASGKTTAAAMLAELGATVLSADVEGRAVMEPGEPALAETIAEFGADYLTPEGRLDRRALGERVFRDPQALAALNRITHPRIRARLEARLEQLTRRPPRSHIVVVEAAILVEAGWVSAVDRVVVIAVQPSTQAHRLIAGFGLGETAAWQRVRAQLAPEERLRYADYRLDGELPLNELRGQVSIIWQDLCRLAAAQSLNEQARV